MGRQLSRRPTAEQIGMLLRHLDVHRNLARGLMRHGAKAMWHQLAAELNAVPDGARKDPKAWSKCWADLKSRVKRKQQTWRVGETGEGLSELEQRILAVMGAGAGEEEEDLSHETTQEMASEDSDPWLDEDLLEEEPTPCPPSSRLTPGTECADPLQAPGIKTESVSPGAPGVARRRLRSRRRPLLYPRGAPTTAAAAAASAEVARMRSSLADSELALAEVERRRAQLDTRGARSLAAAAAALSRLARALELVSTALERIGDASAARPA